MDLDGIFREFGVETCENMLEHVGTRIRWRLFLVRCYAYVTCRRSRVQKDGLQMQDNYSNVRSCCDTGIFVAILQIFPIDSLSLRI